MRCAGGGFRFRTTPVSPPSRYDQRDVFQTAKSTVASACDHKRASALVIAASVWRDHANTHDPCESEQAQRHLPYVSAFEQIGRLEDLLFGDAVLLNGRLKSATREQCYARPVRVAAVFENRWANSTFIPIIFMRFRFARRTFKHVV